MDTDAIYSAVCQYGQAKRCDDPIDEADQMVLIVRLLNEADEEHKSLLATNEKLVDEVNELKAKLTEKAYLLRGCYAADHKQKQRIEELSAERDALKAENERLLAANRDCIAHYEDARAELERIKALPPVAWRTFDGEGGYDYRTYDMNESYAEDYAKRNPNHAHWVDPLYALGSKR